MQQYPYQPPEQAWPPPRPRLRLPRWAWLAGLGIAFALMLGIGALIGSTILPTLGASAASNNGAFAQFARAGANGLGGPMHGPGGGYTVSSSTDTTITATTPKGATVTITTDGSTTYAEAGKTVARSAVTAADTKIRVQGTRASNGNITATHIEIALPHAGGKITAIASDDSSVTVQDPRDSTKTVTIHLSGNTTYTTVTKSASGPPAQTPATVKSLQVGGYIDAQGTKNSDGSLNAQSVRILPGAPPAPGRGPRGGPGGRHGHGPAPATPTSSTTGA
jgi:hypothetical protein